MRPADVENLNFLAAEIQRHAVAKRLIRESGSLFPGRYVPAPHQFQQIGPIVFVADLQHVRVGHVAFRVVVMKRRGNQSAYRLTNGTGHRLALGPCRRLGIQRVEHHQAFARHDDPAVVGGEAVDVVARNDLPQLAHRVDRGGGLPGRTAWRLPCEQCDANEGRQQRGER